jgi:hypothetical protein
MPRSTEAGHCVFGQGLAFGWNEQGARAKMAATAETLPRNLCERSGDLRKAH